MAMEQKRPPISVTSERPRQESGFGELWRVLVQAAVIALVIRTFLFQPFNIPSGSMKATLLVGDYLFVSKYSYGFSHFSLPFSPPLFSGRIFGFPPNRGDVAVFRPPEQPGTDFIKRVIGLPGDRIQVIDGVVQINGVPVKREPAEDFVGDDPCSYMGGARATVRVKQFSESLPNGVSYRTLACSQRGGFPNTNRVYEVPPDHYFMMGDNRENSEDSRFPDVSYVPFENLIGHAQIIFFSIRGGHSAFEI